MEKQIILIWHKTVYSLTRKCKPPSVLGAHHLIGYLRRCADLESLEPDMYITQWIQCVTFLIKRAPESEHLKLLALRDALIDLSHDPSVQSRN